MVFAEDFELVRNIFQSFKSRLRDENPTIVDFSRMCLLTLCTLDLGLPMDDDLVMANPFEELDEYSSSGGSVKPLVIPLRRSYDCHLENDI
ncbi:MAG: hypothetical protein ACI38Y_02890 [Candidatus Methanomethylophilaceae archaeon]